MPETKRSESPEYEPGEGDRRVDESGRPITTTNKARQGVTGHHARHVLAAAIAALIIAYVIVYLVYFA